MNIKKTNVYHVLSDTGVGGAGIFLRNLISATDRKRFSHRVLLPRGARLPGEILTDAGAEVIFGDFAGERSLSLGMLRATATLLSERRPDIVHTHGALSAALAARIFAREVPILTTLHCAIEPRGITVPRDPIRRHWAATSEEAACLLRRRGVPSQRLRVITNGSPRLSPPTDSEREAARRALGIPPDRFAIGISARLEPIKDHATLLSAVARLSAAGEHAVAVIIGDGSLGGALRAQAKRLGISDSVIFVGFVRDVRSVYCALDAHTSCSLGSETSSLALSETMGMGIPQAVSDCAGNLELVGGGRAALVFPRGDADALAERISRFSRSSATRQAYSNAAAAEHAARLSVERMTRRYEQYYLDVLNPLGNKK